MATENGYLRIGYAWAQFRLAETESRTIREHRGAEILTCAGVGCPLCIAGGWAPRYRLMRVFDRETDQVEILKANDALVSALRGAQMKLTLQDYLSDHELVVRMKRGKSDLEVKIRGAVSSNRKERDAELLAGSTINLDNCIRAVDWTALRVAAAARDASRGVLVG